MALNFPNNPAPGQVFTAEGATFIWNGTVWLAQSPAAIPWATPAEALAGVVSDKAMSPQTTRSTFEERARLAQAIGFTGAAGDLPTTFAQLYGTTVFKALSSIIFIAGTAELSSAFTAAQAQEVQYRWSLRDVTRGSVEVTQWVRSSSVNLPAGSLNSAFSINLVALAGDLIIGNDHQVVVEGRKVSAVAAAAVSRVNSYTLAFSL